MEDLTRNGTNTTSGHIEFSYFSLAIILVILIPIVSLNLVLVVILVREKTIPVSVRFLLSNILAACTVVAVGLFMLFMSDVVLSGCQCGQPSKEGCKVMFWVVISGGAARLVFMATYSIVVFVIVKFTVLRVKFTGVLLTSIGVWLAVVVVNSAILVPGVLRIHILDQISCAPHANGPSTYAYSAVYLVLFGIGSFLLTIIMPIITLVYVKRNSLSDSQPLYKAMAFFALFLLVGNASNFIGQAAPILLALVIPESDNKHVDVTINYILGVFVILSLIPTPLFTILFFKPVRKRFTSYCRRCCSRKRKLSFKSRATVSATLESSKEHMQ